MSVNDRLNDLLNANQNKRLAEEKARENRRDNPKILRHTTYQGNRKIQQLGDDIIENGVVLNNQAVEIGDVMLPLAQGNVLRRVDNTNGGESLLGSAYRKAKEEDLDVNGNQFSGSGVPKIPTGGSGGSSGVGNGGGGGKVPTKSSPPSGCVQPPPSCVWSADPTPPSGWQSYGSVTLESGTTLNLYCLAGTSVPDNLGCDFLNAEKWRCAGTSCVPDPSGTYSSQAACEAARVRLYTVSRSGTGAADCAGEGIDIPEDRIPQDSPWTPPYSSSIKAGSTVPCGTSQWDVFDANGLIFTTSGRYTFYNIIDAGFRCP
jgi:hypothetical protein